MKIKDLMISDPITISRDSSISDAIGLMKINNIRHLPVVTEDKKIEGLVTLADLKQGLMPSMVAELSLSDLIIKQPYTVAPEDDIEIAAKLIYKHKIGGMPVINDDKVVGIITETDILRAFIDMMGLLTSSSRIDVALGEEPGRIRELFQIIHDNGGDIISIGLKNISPGRKIYYFRLSPCKTASIKNALKAEGFEVIATAD